MQPYLFPYIGYFQLVKSADLFLLHDDAQWIKGGWINRNYILKQNVPKLWTLPVRRGSSTASINQRDFVPSSSTEVKKLIRFLMDAYRNAPCFDEVMPLVVSIISNPTRRVSHLIGHSISLICGYLGINIKISYTSTYRITSDLKGQSKVIELCKRSGATSYINPAGGTSLYGLTDFARNSLELKFLTPNPEVLTNSSPISQPVSIIHDLMNYDREEINRRLTQFSLITPST